MNFRIFTFLIVGFLIFFALFGLRTAIINYLNLTASVNISATVTASCGNGYIDTGEQCDGSNLGGATCQSLGYNSGTLSCSSLCAYNTSNCSTGGNGSNDVYYTLTTLRSGLGSGKITSSPAGIDCGVICSVSLLWNSSATLTATSFPGSKFVSWSGDCTSTSTTCTVVMTGNKLVTAIFGLGGSNDTYYTLTASRSGSGSGKITSSPSGINCGVICNVSLLWNTSATLTASAASGSKFVKWTGDCTSTSTTCTVVMTGNKSVKATFDISGINDIYYILAISQSGSGSGVISSEPSGINCGIVCNVSFLWNTSIILTASSSVGSSFTNWSGDCTSTSTTCTVVLDNNKSVKATFSSSGLETTKYCEAEQKNIPESDWSETRCGITVTKLCEKEGVNIPAQDWTKARCTATSTPVTVQQIQEAVSVTVEKTKEFVQSSAGTTATRTVSTVGLAATGALVLPSFAEWFLIFIRLGGAVMTFLGIRKRTKPWGTVYDSVTKQPLDPAYVVLQDLQGKEIASSITDLDGRYGFLLEPGKYKMVVKKTNYKFPSEKLAGKTHDEFYENLYFGGELEVKEAGEAISQNIPLDPEKFDWNEFAKRNKKRLRFYSKIDVWLKRISDWFFVFGFVTAVLAVIFAPYPLNFIIVGFYIFILILRKFVTKPKTYGSIIERQTGFPLSFAIIRVFSVELQKEMFKRVADKYGRYFILIPNGKYYVKIEKKNEDTSYTEVFTSDVINVQKGIIREKFRV